MRWLLLVAGCTGGEDKGSDPSQQAQLTGQTTPEPTPDPTGEEDPQLVWVDAAGQVVEGVVQLPEGLALMDGDGYFWAIDPLRAPPDAFTYFEGGRLNGPVYTDAGCTDPWLAGLVTIPPRYVLQHSDTGQMLVAPDELAPERLYDFYEEGTGCELTGGTPVLGYPQDALIEVELPTDTWTAPLHPELR